MNNYTVGIDLGTTNSCVAIFRNGHVEIIENEQGNRTTPSWVSFTDDLILIGSEAVEEYPSNPKNTVYEAKRLIGQKFKDLKVQEDIKRLPYTVFDDLDSPKIRIQLENGNIKEYYPEEISAFILKKLKEVAEARLQTTVTRAVITVPAYFNDAQRQATKDAATIAGFNVINVINEPTAAALAFNYNNPKPYKRNIVVYDFGGGTFDVSIVAIERGKCSVKSTKGNSHLGGLDIDANLVKLIKEDFKKQQGKDLDSGDLTTRRLTAKCENAKKILSTRHQVEVEMDYLAGIDTSFKFNIARIRLEQLNLELFKETLQTVKECLEDSGLKKVDIDEVVLVGGSTRIPKIQQMLSDHFGPDKINKGINPDEAVAVGAAIHASNLAGDKNEVHDVTSLSLGTNTHGDLMSIIIPRNTPIPAKSIKRYQTIMDNQTSMEFPIYQGEKEIASENFELGNFTLANLTEGPAKSVKVEVSFQIDSEGLLNISAAEINSNNKQEVQINVKRKGLTEEQIRQRIMEAQSNREKELRRRRFIEEKHNLETFLYEAKVNSEKCSAATRDFIVAKHDEIWKWLEKVKIEDVDQFEIKKKEMKKVIEENPSECESK